MPSSVSLHKLNACEGTLYANPSQLFAEQEGNKTDRRQSWRPNLNGGVHPAGLASLNGSAHFTMQPVSEWCLYRLLTSHVVVQSPLHYSNVMLADPVTGRPVRVGWRYLEDGTKVSAIYHLSMIVLTLHGLLSSIGSLQL